MKSRFVNTGALALLVTALGCGGGGEAAKVTLPLVASTEPLTPFENDLGFAVELRSVSLPLKDLQLTGRGEAHVRRVLSWLLPVAHAHPGHETGGAVLGERLGAFDVRFGEGAAGQERLGEVTVLEGGLRGAAFRFRGDVPVLLEGEAVRGDGTRVPFSIEAVLAEGARVDGVIFHLDATAQTRGRLVLRLLPVSARGRTLFDAVDFENDDEAAARNAVRRALQDHAHYELLFQPEEEST